MNNTTSTRLARPLLRLGQAIFLSFALATSTMAADAKFELSSPELSPGKPIPLSMVANAYSCKGADESPALEWKNAPPGTKSFAVTMFDPVTPPTSGWWHWLAYDIPATAKGLPHNAGAKTGGMPAGAKQSRPDGDAPEPRYYGPCPTRGDPPHPYVITVYALSVERLEAPPTSTAANIDYEISTHTLAKAAITLPYSRPKIGQ